MLTNIDLKNYVLLAEPGGEKRACEYLEDEGFDPYVPMETRTITVLVRSMFGCYRRPREVTRPIFPGYLFVPLNHAWGFGPVDKCPGLRKDGNRYLRRPDNGYRTLDDSDMAILRRIETALNSSGLPFMVGEKVRLLDGPFADHVAEISRMDDAERIELLMDFLGQKSKLVASVSQIAAV